MKHRNAIAIFVLTIVLTLSGCAARPLHPGAVNQFDSQSYDILLVTDSVIQSVKTDLNNGVFSATVAPKVKDAVNYLITAYNIADTAYRTYHAAAIAGTVTPSQQSAVSASLVDVANATQSLINAKAGK